MEGFTNTLSKLPTSEWETEGGKHTLATVLWRFALHCEKGTHSPRAVILTSLMFGAVENFFFFAHSNIDLMKARIA